MGFQERISRLQKWLEEHSCDALLIENKIDLFYLTGLDLSAGKMIVGAKEACLIVDKRYFELCQKTSPVPVFPSEENSWDQFFEKQAYAWIKKFAFDSENTSYQNYLNLHAALHSRLELIPFQDPIKRLRMLKDEGEIKILREAGDLGAKGFDYVCTLLTEGVTEIELANELEIFWKKNGGKGLAFDPIIAFGANSSMPHYRAGNTQLQNNQIVLLDIGVNYQQYHSDMTRTVFFGIPDPILAEVYEVVKGAQKAALALCRPGTSIAKLDDAARSYIKEHGYGEKFTHSLGHGIGLEVHEMPLLRNKPPYSEIELEAGMVITIEPGIYIEGLGGVRLEDTIAITASGYENLTNRPLEPKLPT